LQHIQQEEADSLQSLKYLSTSTMFIPQLTNILTIWGDYKWCERLRKLIGKNRSHHL